MRLSRSVASFAVVSLLAAQLSGCASSPKHEKSRTVSSEEVPLNAEQLRNLGDLGIGILRLSVLGNAVSRENRINTELTANLQKIEADRKASISGAGGIAMGIGLTAIVGAIAKQSIDELFESIFSGFSILFGGTGTVVAAGPDKSMRIAYSAGGGLAVSGAVLLVAGSIGSESLRNTGGATAEEEKAKKRRTELQAELDRSIDAMKDVYAGVFGLDPSQSLVLRGKIRAEIMEKAKAGQDNITIDVPQMMIQSGLISEAAFVSFRSNLASLETIERSNASLRGVLDARNYDANIEQCKTIVKTYIAWIKSIQAEVTNPGDAGRVAKALANAERLLARI